MSPFKVIPTVTRTGLRVTFATLSFTVKTTGQVISLAEALLRPPSPSDATRGAGRSAADTSERRDGAPTPAAGPASTGASGRTEEAASGVSASAGVVEAAMSAADEGVEIIAPDDLPDTPLSREEADAKTVDDTDEVVGEFAERGAEDGAGAAIHFDEPWTGYSVQDAGSITDRLGSADAAEIAVLELYEQAHHNRSSVLKAAEKRLKELSPPSDD